MYILAFKEGYDPAACLLKDGEIIAAAEEERFIRQKHAPAVFPAQSIKFCLDFAGLKEEDVDYVVFARLKPARAFLKVLWYYLTHFPNQAIKWRYFISHLKVQIVGTFQELTGQANYQKIHKFFPNLPKKIYSFGHHLSHAASAYYYSKFDESLIITMDGKGEADSMIIAEAKGNQIKILERRDIFFSLGLFYASITKYLGFKPDDGEYKVMGLAPYGRPAYSFDDILKPDSKNGYKINPNFIMSPFSIKALEKRFGRSRKKEGELTSHYKNLAASAQKALEDSALSLVKYALQKTKSRNLCLAGGVALNVKMNKKIWESGLIDDIFIQPAAGDNGLVLGAAALLFEKISGQRVKPLKDLYFGPEYHNQEIKETLDEYKLKYHFLEPPIEKTVDLLVRGKVVGWFQGRMEFGPRALGNRSILAHPGLKEMKKIVNQKIKFREWFRPFCPSILEEFARQYFKKNISSPYMIMSFAAKDKEIEKKIPAVVHIDGTIRPQAVSKESNLLYYKLIEHFYEKTGLPLLLNTSMNVRGEPIVCSPKDLVRFFLRTNIDAAVAGNYLIIKEEQDKSLSIPLFEKTLATDY